MASNPQHEPTMEEILASIRKIISEDSNEAAAEAVPAAKPVAPAPVQQAPAPVPQPVPEPEEEVDVLELTQEVREEPVAPPPPPMRAPAPHADEVVFQPKEEAAVSSVRANEPVHSPEGIFSDKSRKALDDTFATLDSLDDEDDAPAPERTGSMPAMDGATVEAVFERAVRESFEPVLREWLADNADPIVEKMKPIIRDWLDEHFPTLLEEAVRGEVARVVRTRKR